MLAIFIRNCLVACGVGFLAVSGTVPAQAEIIVNSSGPFRLGAGLGASQSAPSITPFGGNGSISAFVSPGGSSQYPYVNYHSIFGNPRGTVNLRSATGPTTGVRASSTAAVSFFDASALILFSAAPLVGGGQDIFAQRLSAFRQKEGAPVRINQTTANLQDSVFAARLSGGSVLATWLTHGTAPSSFNLRGRVVNSSGGGSFNEVAVTIDTVGAQTQTGIAGLTNGNSAIAYVVKTGSGASTKHTSYVQLLGRTGTRIGGPKLIKQTTGVNTYGSVGVAALPGGRFIAIWFTPANGGRAALKRKIFQAGGTPGAIGTIGTVFSIRPTSPAAPKVIFSKDGVLVAFDGFVSGTSTVAALLLNNAGALIADVKVLGSGAQPLAATTLSYDSVSNIYYVAWTQKLPSSTRSFGNSFYVSQGCSVRC